MFSLQTIVLFLLSVAVLFFSRKLLRSIQRAFFARFNSYLINEFLVLVKSQKEKIFGELHEIAGDHRPLKVLEIAAGAGANFRFLPKNTEIICVEPNEWSKKYLLARAAEFPDLKVRFHLGVAENLSFIESESMDAVIGTHALCSVTDVDQCLAEILRILKKGGKYIFLEQILAPDGDRIQSWQYFLRPMWHFLLEGCTLTRRTYNNIQKAGFSKADIELCTCNLQNVYSFLILARYHCAGVAVK